MRFALVQEGALTHLYSAAAPFPPWSSVESASGSGWGGGGGAAQEPPPPPSEGNWCGCTQTAHAGYGSLPRARTNMQGYGNACKSTRPYRCCMCMCVYACAYGFMHHSAQPSNDLWYFLPPCSLLGRVKPEETSPLEVPSVSFFAFCCAEGRFRAVACGRVASTSTNKSVYSMFYVLSGCLSVWRVVLCLHVLVQVDRPDVPFSTFWAVNIEGLMHGI